VNPGAGIWSEKLHDFLKPRAHILLEPDQAKYQVLLQPLLNTPGSTYKLIPKSGVVWGHLEKILSKHHLPHQEPFERGDPRLEQRNDSLIFIANLGYVQKRGYGGFSSVANLVLYQLMSAIRAHSLFQRYGQVRMLIWIENGERDTILPRTISLRRKSAVEAEISCEKLEEVASSTDEIGHFTRENYLELERTRLVYEKMKEMGISVPTGRESTILKQLFSGNPRDMKEDIFTSAFLEEIHDLETRFAAGEFKEEVEIDLPKRSPRQLGRQKKKITPEFARLKDLRYRQSSELRKFETASEIKRELDKIYSMQREIQRAGKSKRYALEELKQRTQAWKERFSALAFAYRENISVMLDNDRAFETNPPTLAWDRREVEPLKVQPAEFYPHREMCLLDIQPKPIWPILQKNFSENYDILEYIIGQLFIVPPQTIKKGLSALAPGAYDYLIVECPSLSDPTRGGSLDVELMTVRRLTEEMLKEILEAWLRWPFKPTRFEVMRRLGSNVYDPDSIAVEELG
jgi:mitochondrial transcription factor 1